MTDAQFVAFIALLIAAGDAAWPDDPPPLIEWDRA